MKYLYRNDSIWKFVTIFCHTQFYFAIVQRIIVIFFFTNGYLTLKFDNFAVLSKNIRYYFDNRNFMKQERNYEQLSNKFLRTFY
jgi:hypothetical protein